MQRNRLAPAPNMAGSSSGGFLGRTAPEKREFPDKSQFTWTANKSNSLFGTSGKPVDSKPAPPNVALAGFTKVC